MEAKRGKTLYAFNVHEGGLNKVVLAVFGSLVTILIAYFAYNVNYLAVLIFTIIGFITVVSFFQNRSRVTSYKIKTTGVQVDNNLYPYEHLKSFWIFPDTPELSIKSKKALVGYIKIPIDYEDVETVKALVSKFLPERKHKDTISDNIIRALGL